MATGIETIYTNAQIDRLAHERFAEERAIRRLDGWFRIKEIRRDCDARLAGLTPVLKAAQTLLSIAQELPISLSDKAIFAGTQDDAFARSYALINPSFEVESFTGYCDPTAVFGDIEPDDEFTVERIEALRAYEKTLPFTQALGQAYEQAGSATEEAVFFIEQVTGHLIPDFRTVLANGVDGVLADLDRQLAAVDDAQRRDVFAAIKIALQAVLVLAGRYAALARALQASASGERLAALELLAQTLERVPRQPARNLFEAIQSFILLWQLMCIEQAPNPFAFSVGNADRLFEPYRALEGTSRATSAALFKHLLTFFNVADRSWAISQNLMVGGRSVDSSDLTNPTSYALLDAYFEMNLPQPILSVKLHRATPAALHEEMGRFFFSPGVLTPSLFNDDSLFRVLAASGVEDTDLPDYAIAGCQEPLVMGKDNGNTTNSWLNLAKILELTLHDGVSAISGRRLGLDHAALGIKSGQPAELLFNIREAFYAHVEHFVDAMVAAANAASRAIGLLPVPFLSAFMGGVESGVDMRDSTRQGTRYNGSGCLIHGLSVVADSFVAIDCFLREHCDDSTQAARLLAALRNDFKDDEALRQYLASCPKFGNAIDAVDREAGEIVRRVSALVAGKRNYLGNPFRADWSTPSTHLLYGYWVAATPDGRRAREMLGYGVDPLYGEAQSGLGLRVLSALRLPYKAMNGGYASHFGINPAHFRAPTLAGKGSEFARKVVAPLFADGADGEPGPFYLYVNVTTPETLRQVLADPKRYAPSGVYIMRIHGTFVNFLDLSPAIQQDIIKRLDLDSTALA
jgi:formate C-acetyltransferase